MKRRIIRQALIACAVSLPLLFAGCTTVQTRIAERQQVYQGLSPNDQALVQQGKIRDGMSTDAVYIAWGPPDQRLPGHFRGHNVETWVYSATYAGPYYGPYYGGYGYGGYGFGLGFSGGYHRRFRSGFYYDPFYDPWFYNSANVIRYPERTVSFQSGRVIAWQYLPQPRMF